MNRIQITVTNRLAFDFVSQNPNLFNLPIRTIFNDAADNSENINDLISEMIKIINFLGIEDLEVLSVILDKTCLTITEFNFLKTFRANKKTLKSIEDVCGICIDSYKSNQLITKTVCGHNMHKKCLKLWLTKNSINCPLCRENQLE